MTRGQVKRRLALAWWRQLGVALAPLLVFNLLVDLGYAFVDPRIDVTAKGSGR